MTRYILVVIALLGVAVLWALNLREAAAWHYTAKGLVQLRAGEKLLSSPSTASTTATSNSAEQRAERVKLHFTLALSEFSKAEQFDPKNPYPNLFKGVCAALQKDEQSAEKHFQQFVKVHPQDFGVPLKAWLEYKGSPTVNPFQNLSIPDLKISPYSSILCAWFAYHRKDIPTTRNFLLRARSAKNLSAEYRYLNALVDMEDGKLDSAYEHIVQARTISSSRNRITNFGLSLFPIPVVARSEGKGVSIERGPWKREFFPFGARSRERKSEMLYNLCLLNFLKGKFHRSLFLSEIIKKNYSPDLTSKERMPELELLAYPCGYRAAVMNNATHFGLNPFFVFAVIREESKFKIAARSGAQARGLMQVTPDTARWICMRMKLRYREGMLEDPETNIRLGCWFLKYLKGRFTDRKTRKKWVLAAYNAGLTKAERWCRRWVAKGKRGSVVHYVPYRETKDYIVRVLSSFEIYSRIHGRKRR